jgi:outer membrane protein
MKHTKYNKMITLGLAAMLAVPTSQGFAQGTKHLSLDEAVKLSVENSGKLRISNAKVEEATANVHEAKNNQLPDLKISGSYLRVNSPTVDLKVKLGSSSGSGSGSGGVKVEQAAYALANASLPLFSGLRIKYGIESAKYLQQAAKLDAEKDKEEVIQVSIDAYNNLYKSKKTVDLIKENLNREKQRVQDFGNLEKNGLMARNDLLKAQLQQSNVELALLDAENNFRITCINMDLLLGLPENTDLMPDSTGFMSIPDAGSAIQWEQTAFQNRKDKAALGFRMQASSSAIRAAKGEYYPGVAITGGYIAADIPNLLTLTNALNIGIGLQYNVGSLWKAGAKVEAAKARYHEIEATEGILNDQVRLEVNHAYENYLLSQKKITVYAKSIEQANENYRITKNKYDNNLVTTTDLLEADVAQLQSELNYAFSKADALVAYKKLEQSAGVLAK